MRAQVLRLLAMMAAFAIAVTVWAVSSPRNSANASVGITVDATRPLQTVQALGVNVNSRSWNGGQLRSALDLLTGTLGANAFRVVIDNADWEATNDDSDPNHFNWDYYNALYSSPKFQDLWDTIAYLNGKGVTVSLSVMGPLAKWMGGSTLATNEESEWVEMMASLIDYGRTVRHLMFDLAEPFNEPDWNGIEGVQAPASQVVRVMHALGVKLDALGLQDVRFILPDTASTSAGLGTYLSAMVADPYLMSKVSAIGLHSYNGDSGGADAAIRASAYPNLPFWMTEFAAWCSGCDTGSPNPGDWPYARTSATYLMAHLSQNAAGAEVWEGYDSYYDHHGAWSYWGLLAYDQASGTYTPRKSFYAMEQFMRFIPPGAVRIAASAGSGVSVLAFRDPASGRITVVGMNTSSSTQTLSGTLAGVSGVTGLSYYRTNSNADMEAMGTVPVSGSTFSVNVAGDTLFTLTGIPGPDATPPTVTLTAPANGARVAASTQLAAQASDDRGVARVEFSVDGSLVAADSVAPYQAIWDARTVSPGTHTVTAAAFDLAGNRAASSAAVTVVADTTPPTAPSGLAASAPSASQVSLTWQASTDEFGVADYIVLRDGVQVGTTSSTAYDDTGVTAGATYAYTVEARDPSGNISSPSAAATVTVGSQAPLALDGTPATTHQTVASTTISSPPFSTSKAGDLLVVFASSDGPATATQSFTTVAGGGLTWQRRQRANVQAGTAEIWTAVAPVVLSNISITATRASGSFLGALTVAAFSGADTTASGATAAASAPTGAPTVGLTTTRSGSMVWAVGDDWDRAVARTVPTGQVLEDQYLASVGDTFWVQRLSNPVGATGTAVTIYDTAPTTDRWNLAAIEVMPASGPAPDTTPPSAPTGLAATATSPSTVNLTWASSTDNVGVTGYTVVRNGTTVASPTSTGYVDSGVSPATTYTYAVTARDAAGNISTPSNPATVTTPALPDTEPPSISITQPADGSTVSGPLAITASATDNTAVTGVEFKVDNIVAMTDTAAPWTYTWDTTSASNGTHTITATASDAAGNRTPTTITVTVANPTVTSPLIDTQTTIHQSRSSAIITSPAFSTTQPGDLLVAFASSDGPRTGLQSFRSVTGAGLAWTLRQRANAQPGTAEIWTAVASSTLREVTVSGTLNSGSYLGSLTVVAFREADTATAGAGSAASAASGPASVRLTTTKAGSVVWAVGEDWDRATARTVGTGQETVDQYLATTVRNTFWVQRLSAPVDAAGTTVTVNDTRPTSDRWNLAALEIRAR